MSDANELFQTPPQLTKTGTLTCFIPTRGPTCLDRQRRHRPRLCCIVVKRADGVLAWIHPLSICMDRWPCNECILTHFARDWTSRRKPAEVVAPGDGKTTSPHPLHHCVFLWRDARKNDILVPLKTLQWVSHHHPPYTHTNTQAGIQQINTPFISISKVGYCSQQGGYPPPFIAFLPSGCLLHG